MDFQAREDTKGTSFFVHLTLIYIRPTTNGLCAKNNAWLDQYGPKDMKNTDNGHKGTYHMKRSIYSRPLKPRLRCKCWAPGSAESSYNSVTETLLRLGQMDGGALLHVRMDLDKLIWVHSPLEVLEENVKQAAAIAAALECFCALQ